MVILPHHVKRHTMRKFVEHPIIIDIERDVSPFVAVFLTLNLRNYLNLFRSLRDTNKQIPPTSHSPKLNREATAFFCKFVS